MWKHFDMRVEVHAARWRAVSLWDRAKHRPIDQSWPTNDEIVTASRLKVLWRVSWYMYVYTLCTNVGRSFTRTNLVHRSPISQSLSFFSLPVIDCVTSLVISIIIIISFAIHLVISVIIIRVLYVIYWLYLNIKIFADVEGEIFNTRYKLYMNLITI